ncbi:MAG: hypothetical protein VKL39_23955 [Leptolyngbyaceae bacterium]|nr:hypothetical protein [Leptolyngbyaceae bacterium]
MKKYFVSTRGDINEYEVHKSDSVRPQDGCDMLVRDKHGHVYSASSSVYFDTVEEAAQRWVEQQKLYIDRLTSRLSSEVAALRNLQANLRSFNSGEIDNASN